ncbi:DUF58 domain-containing protein [Simiduia sp. 21SJ11W-1]|uniref:DUF58 domain-containing protein n=1 Tax=Simiduia sp. 21SJ11W-1 TaxID=2909669 RepID=UPI00209F2163|nr:DUF58 domain-containing protein [Simiduia sp. 21SJ11W-1]UTA49361.1 DUF58 domain-containing protein [Simiduia sp. 21SJ11W-1]
MNDFLQPKGPYTDLRALVQTRLAAKDLSLPAKARSQSLLHGARRTHFRGRGMEFAEIRAYQPGDDVRTIDWRVTARAQKPFTKLYSEEREKPVFLLVDQRASMFFGSRQCFKSVYAAHLACLLGWAASQAGDRIGAMLAHASGITDLRPKGRQHAMLNMINQLHTCNHALTQPFGLAEEVSLGNQLSQCARALKPGTTLAIISDFSDWTPAAERQLSLIGRHNDVLLIHLYDQLEAQPPADSRLAISNGTQRLQLNAPQAAAISRAFGQRCQSLEASARKLGLSFYSLEISTPLLPWLIQHFGRNRATRGAR